MIVAVTDPARKALLRRGFALEYATLAWNVGGIVIMAIAAVSARSVALAGFGLDSLIEIGASTRRVWERRCLSCIGDSGSRPAAGCTSEHLGEPAFRKRAAGLHAEPVRGHRRVIDSAGPQHLIIMLPAGGDGRQPGGLTRRPARRV